MLALADAIVVTMDSVSMISEAVATTAPVMLARLPGRSRRKRLFPRCCCARAACACSPAGWRLWPVTPLDDTAEAAAEMCRRLGLPHPETPC